MGLIISSIFGQLFGKKEIRVLILGLDNAGKTTILRIVAGWPKPPCRGDDRVNHQRVLDRLVNAQFHQQQCDGDVEDQPYDAAGVVMRQAGEEVRPCDRSGIGIGDVDLDL